MTGPEADVSTIPEILAKAARNPALAMRVAVDRSVRRARHAGNAVEGARDARRLKRERPPMVPAPVEREELHALYRVYVAEVSLPGMAISWESSCYVRHLCDAFRPHRLVDLGSGFSSCVLRDYAASAPHEVSVVSVDDSEEWLGKTHEFLAAHGHDSGELRGWEDFAADPGAPFDVVFHDLAAGELREQAMSVAVSALAPSGLIVFDDAQHRGHRHAARQISSQAGLSTYSLHRWTNDAFGRFAMLGAP
jgi:predicted O-methyltransferase YrrM